MDNRFDDVDIQLNFQRFVWENQRLPDPDFYERQAIDIEWKKYTTELFGSPHPPKAHKKRYEAFCARWRAHAAVDRAEH